MRSCPCPTAGSGGTPLAYEYLQIKVGVDLALFQALGHLLLAEENPGTVVAPPFPVPWPGQLEDSRESSNWPGDRLQVGSYMSRRVELITQRLQRETDAWGNKSPTHGSPWVGDFSWTGTVAIS